MAVGMGPWKRLRWGIAAGSAALLAGCGGGGGGSISTPAPPVAPAPSPTPAPTPTPTPTPTSTPTPGPAPSPTPSPVPSAFNTSEFRRSDGPHEHNAAIAWNSGWTGQGVAIAVVDTGIDTDSPEFAGRIHAASRDMFSGSSTRGLDSTDDHGTNVAMVAAAARDGTGILGMAWSASIMALRTDTPGSCATDSGSTVDDADCSFSDDVIARAIDHAVANGAKVINISLGGDGSTALLRSAVLSAANAGVAIVVSAGNDGAAEASAFARQLASVGAGGVIVVGATGEDGLIADFSNRAGSQSDRFIAARGERICCTYQDGKLHVDSEGFVYLFSGTSFAAPQVSGAAALLAQAFPHLTGRQIIDILLRSAFDAGAPGADAVYGRGILDLARAFQPLGTTSLAGSAAPIAMADSSGATSPAMGDAAARVSMPTVVLDEYSRAFGVDLAGTLGAARPAEPLMGAVGRASRQLSGGDDAVALAFSIDARGEAGEMPRIRQLRLSGEDAQAARVMAGRAAMRVAPGTQVAFAFAEGANGIVAQLQGQERPAFLIAGDAAGESGQHRTNELSFALRQRAGPWGVTLSANSGQTLTSSLMRRAAQLRGRRDRAGVQDFALTLDRQWGPVDARIGATWMREEETVLGARLHDAFGLTGAETLFLDAGVRWSLAPGWRLGGALRQGWTQAREGQVVAGGSRLASRAWSLDLAREGVLAPGDSIGLRLSQPLRVEGGAVNLLLPVDYSYDTQTPTYGVRSLALSPQGRELAAELAWRGRLWNGAAAASLFYRKDPGHFASLPDDRGAAVSWSRRF